MRGPIYFPSNVTLNSEPHHPLSLPLSALLGWPNLNLGLTDQLKVSLSMGLYQKGMIPYLPLWAPSIPAPAPPPPPSTYHHVYFIPVTKKDPYFDLRFFRGKIACFKFATVESTKSPVITMMSGFITETMFTTLSSAACPIIGPK